MEQDGGETDSIVAGSRDLITLAQPRPGAARKQNEYIETPQLPVPKVVKGRLKDEGSPCCVRPPITAQPTAKSKSDDQRHGESIICRDCRRCKCESCRNPRQLPSKWICNDKCLCSASSVVDYCSCVCCVRGLFYHWAKDYEMESGVSCADQPCSCSPHRRLLRWGCLGLLSLPLPCLCCYWPMRGCLRASEGFYSKCATHGCQCDPPHITEQAPEKLLLNSNSEC